MRGLYNIQLSWDSAQFHDFA